MQRRGPAGRRLAGTLVPQPAVLVDGRRCRLDDVLGEGAAELRLAGGGLVVVRADGTQTPIEDPGGTLVHWLQRGRATRVVVRPDRIVQSAR